MANGGHTHTRLAERRATDGHTTVMVCLEEVACLIARPKAVVAPAPAARALVSSARDPQDRPVQLTITARAEAIVGGIDLDTARRLQTVFNGMSPQARRYLIDVLRDAVRRSAGAKRSPLARNILAPCGIHGEVYENGQRG